MTDPSKDVTSSSFSSLSSSSINPRNLNFDSSFESYSNVFDKDLHHFTNSSEISLINPDHEKLNSNPLSTILNETFTKTSRTIINAFTGKPISPNPWRKLSSKIHEPNIISSNLITKEKTINHSSPHRQLTNRIVTHISPSNPQVVNNTNDEDNPLFEQFVQEDRYLIENSSLQRRRKKRNSLKDSIDNASLSSDESVKECSTDILPKINQSIDNEASWYRLGDVYTSDSSDENNHSIKSNINYSFRITSDNYTLDQSSISTSSTINNFNFLESLSERIPMDNKHSDAKSYFLQPGFKLKQKREELANKLLLIFNKDVFSSQLSNKISVVWSGRLTATAGHCTTRRNTRTAVITLSHKVCDSPERCRDTLLHEMCHAAVTLIDDVMEPGHGPLWKKWTLLAQVSYPYLPPISVRHTYDVIYKFTYRCVECQYEVYRHSKSINQAVDVCGKCMGNFKLIVNNNNDIHQDRQTPKKPINKYNLYVKENFQLLKQTNPYLTTPQLMRRLSQDYKQKNQQQEHLEMPDLDQLTI